MDEIIKISKEFNLKVLEDAAPAIGATVNNKFCGTYGDIAAFSFQGAKMMVTGEGGILLTNNDDYYEEIKQFSEHGRSKDPDKTFWIEKIGYKYKMSNIQAALGLAQFERIDELIEKKRTLFSYYWENLSDIEGVTLNKEARWAKSIYWMTSILLDKNIGKSRDELAKYLKNNDIDSRPVFPAISKYPMWSSQNLNPVSIEISENALNLPSGHNLNKKHIDLICGKIKEYLI